jgi:hypothetical protein
VDNPEDIADEVPKPDPLTTALPGGSENTGALDGGGTPESLAEAADLDAEAVNPASAGEVTGGSGPGLYQLRSPGLRPHRRATRPAFALRNDCPPSGRRPAPKDRPRTRLI